MRYPFKPGRDGSCQRQPRLERDVAARQARGRSRGASGEQRWRRGRARQVPSPPAELSNPGPGEAGGAQCNAENVRGSAGRWGGGGAREGGGRIDGETAGERKDRERGAGGRKEKR